MLKRSNLNEYQQMAIDWCKRRALSGARDSGGLLVLPMSFGKTATALTVASDLIDRKKVKKVLVSAPLNVALASWPDELENWEHLCDLDSVILRAENLKEVRRDSYREFDSRWKYDWGLSYENCFGIERANALKLKFGLEDRRAALMEAVLSDCEIHIVNNENLPFLWETIRTNLTEDEFPYDMLIVDESTVAKNGKLSVVDSDTGVKKLTRFGVLYQLSLRVKSVFCLTGTPMPRGAENLWGQLYLVDGGERLCNNLHHFKNKFLHGQLGGGDFGRKVATKGDFAEIMARIRDVCFCLPQASVGELPPIIYRQRMLNLPKKYQAEYDKLSATLLLQNEELSLQFKSAPEVWQKLRQYANGSVYDTEKLTHEVNRVKLKDVREFVREMDGDPLLIAYAYQNNRDELLKLFPHAEVFGEGDVREQIRRWNNKEIEILLGHPQSIAHGVNLQKGGNHVYWYGLTPDLELYQQLNKRLHRKGQTMPVYIANTVMRNTVEEKIVKVLQQRAERQEHFIDEMDSRR